MKYLVTKIKKILIKFLSKNDEELRIMDRLHQLDYIPENYGIISQYYLQLSNGIALRLGRTGDDKITLKRVEYYYFRYKKYRELFLKINE